MHWSQEVHPFQRILHPLSCHHTFRHLASLPPPFFSSVKTSPSNTEDTHLQRNQASTLDHSLAISWQLAGIRPEIYDLTIHSFEVQDPEVGIPMEGHQTLSFHLVDVKCTFSIKINFTSRHVGWRNADAHAVLVKRATALALPYQSVSKLVADSTNAEQTELLADNTLDVLFDLKPDTVFVYLCADWSKLVASFHILTSFGNEFLKNPVMGTSIFNACLTLALLQCIPLLTSVFGLKVKWSPDGKTLNNDENFDTSHDPGTEANLTPHARENPPEKRSFNMDISERVQRIDAIGLSNDHPTHASNSQSEFDHHEPPRTNAVDASTADTGPDAQYTRSNLDEWISSLDEEEYLEFVRFLHDYYMAETDEEDGNRDEEGVAGTEGRNHDTWGTGAGGRVHFGLMMLEAVRQR